MSKGGSAKQYVTEYRMSIHLGICHAADAITKIIIGDKVAWQGRQVGPGVIDINKPDLFGGIKKEGGVVGKVYILPGGPTQTMPEELARRLGKTTATCPGFRGLYSVFFVGYGDYSQIAQTGTVARTRVIREGDGFYWSANSPFVQPMKFEVERKPVGLDPDLAIFADGSVNPAHIIYECLTDSDFGMGAASYQMNTAKFNAVAEQLWDEEFGLAMIWTRQAEIEKFVGEVLDHIQATVYVNPENGLFEIQLLRDDWLFETVPILNPSNSNFLSFTRKMWGETANEVVVTWTNPANEKEETVVYHDLSNIVNQGAIVSNSRNYYGVRNAELASRLAARESRASSAPLAFIEVETMRGEWDVLPGELRRVTWPEKNLQDVVMRVMKVRNGPKGDGKFVLSLMEDVFSLARPTIAPPPSSLQTEPEEPAPIAEAEVITLPAFMANQVLDRTTASDLTYPEVLAGILAYQEGRDSINYELLGEEPNINGTIVWENIGTHSLVGRAELPDGLALEAVTTLEGAPLAEIGRGPQIGSFAVIGAGGDGVMEFASIRSYADGVWTLDRGVLDTVPKEWGVDTPVWFLPLGSVIWDDNVRAAGETVEYKILPRTSLGVLADEDAPLTSGTLTGRPHLPLRPANVKINGVGFGEVDATGATNLVVTWANRNRLFEDVQVLKWTDGNVAPEYLQETLISVFREDGTLLFEVRGLWTETTYTIPLSYVEEETSVFIRLSCIRQGLRSLQSYGLWVRNLPVVGTPATPPASPIVVGSAAPPPEPEPEPEPEPLPDPTPPPTIDPGTLVPWLRRRYLPY